MIPCNASTEYKMDTTKDAEPNKTQAVGEATVAKKTPAAADNLTPSGNLASSKDDEGGPGVTKGGTGNLDHDVPEDLTTPTSVRPGLRGKRKIRPSSRYSGYILTTKLPHRGPVRKEPATIDVPDASGGPSVAASMADTVSTSESQTRAQANITFNEVDAKLIEFAELIRNFNSSATSMNCARLREELLSARRAIIPYHENKLAPELKDQRTRLIDQLENLSLQLTAKTDALECIIPSGPRITPEQLCIGDQSTRGLQLEGESEYDQQDPQYIPHFLGLVTTNNVTRPDNKGFLTLSQHPARILFREVKAEVRLDTLDDLITQMARVTNNVYKISSARLSGREATYVINKITALDDSVAILNQSYRLFCYQYDQRINETGLSGKAETLLAELRFLMDDQDDKGYEGYLKLVKTQRDEAMQYVKVDEDERT